MLDAKRHKDSNDLEKSQIDGCTGYLSDVFEADALFSVFRFRSVFGSVTVVEELRFLLHVFTRHAVRCTRLHWEDACSVSAS